MKAVYTITSGLHDEASVSRLSDDFLGSVFPEGDYGLTSKSMCLSIDIL